LLVGFGVFVYIQNVQQEKLSAERVERLQQLKRLRQTQIKDLLEAVNVALSDKDLQLTQAHIKRASLLDVESEFAHEISLLKLSYLDAKKLKLLESLTGEISQLIEQKNFVAARRLLRSLPQQLTEHDVEQLDRMVSAAQVRFKDEELRQIEDSIVSWQLDGAQTRLTALRERIPSFETSEIDNRLERLIESDRSAKKRAKKIREADEGAFSKVLYQELLSALKATPEHPQLLAIKDAFDAYLMCINVPADLSTLDEALEFAPDGCQITLGEGIYYLSGIVFEESVSIIGESELTVIEGHTHAVPMLKVANDSTRVEISNIHFRSLDDELQGGCSLMVVESGDLILNHCVVSRSGGHGVEVRAGSFEAKNSFFSMNALNGVAVRGQESQAKLDNCDNALNGGHGVEAWDGGEISISNTKLRSNAKSGVVATGVDSKLSIDSSYITGNTHAGVFMNGGANVKISNSHISSNTFSGVCVLDSQSILNLEKVSVRENAEYGILADANSDVRTEGCNIAGNQLGEKKFKNKR
jgi:hypothetical protein